MYDGMLVACEGIHVAGLSNPRRILIIQKNFCQLSKGSAINW